MAPTRWRLGASFVKMPATSARRLISPVRRPSEWLGYPVSHATTRPRPPDVGCAASRLSAGFVTAEILHVDGGQSAGY